MSLFYKRNRTNWAAFIQFSLIALGGFFNFNIVQLLAQEIPQKCESREDINEGTPYCIVEIQAYLWKNKTDAPWVTKSVEGDRKMGILLGNHGFILATAQQLSGQGLLRVRYSASKKYDSAKLIAIDTVADLALLQLESMNLSGEKEEWKASLQSLHSQIAKDPKLGADTHLVSLAEDTFKFPLQVGTVKFHQVQVRHDGKGTYLPVFQYIGGRSSLKDGALICDGLLCGFAVQKTTKKDLYSSVSPSMLNRFLEWVIGNLSDSKNLVMQSHAFVSAGYRTLALNDQMRRDQYHVPQDMSGVLVISVYVGGSAFSKLQIHDVIVSIAGKRIDNYGYYMDEKYGRLYSPLLFFFDGSRIRNVGEVIPVKILRAGKFKTILIQSTSSQYNSEKIPLEISPSFYVIENGILFVELSVKLLEEIYGKNWKRQAILSSYLYETQRFYNKKNNNRIVVIANVLPDESNQNLANLSMQMVMKLNGKRIANLKDFHGLLKDLILREENVAKLELFGGAHVFLDLENRIVINKRIRQRYNIQRMHSMHHPSSSIAE